MIAAWWHSDLMSAKFTFGKFKEIVVREFSCEVQGDVFPSFIRRHVTPRRDDLPLRVPIQWEDDDDDEEMEPEIIEYMCDRLKIELDEFKKYAPEAFLED